MTNSGPASSENKNAQPANRREVSYDPETLMKIKSLELRAKVVVEGFMNGIHRSPYHGFSVEFTDYRQYSPGDDLRYLDWKLLGRSDRYYIKRFEDETNLNCYLLTDLSRSMGYSSLEYTKADYARTLAATLAYFLSLQRDAVGLLTFDENIDEFLPARFRPGHLRRVMLALDRAVAGKATNVAKPLEQIARQVTRRGMIVLISDLLSPIDDIQKNLKFLRSRGHEVAVLRILDPTEIDFKFQNAAQFVDVESDREMYVDPPAAREEYLKNFRAHETQLKEICDQNGINFRTTTTNSPLKESLFEFISARGQLLSGVSARTRAGRSSTRRTTASQEKTG